MQKLDRSQTLMQLLREKINYNNLLVIFMIIFFKNSVIPIFSIDKYQVYEMYKNIFNIITLFKQFKTFEVV